jgi:antitoxin component YwqK of YwqJK toxin-antitoxin module
MTKLLLILMVVGLWSGCGGEIKVFTKKYPDGEIKEEYQYYNNPDDNRRMKDGWYNSYYPNGDYWEVGTYKENKRDGEWSYFTEDGKETKGIYDNGKKDSGEFWINVKTDGGWEETENETPDDNKVWRGLFTYSDGVWNGLVVLYWMNGHKRSEGLWGRGGGQGKWVRYYESGKVEWEGNYVDGKQEGKWVGYYKDGKVDWEVNYVDGKQEGKWVKYYESGEIRWEGNYVDGKREGEWVWYDRGGNITDEDIYKDGECVKKCEGDEDKDE